MSMAYEAQLLTVPDVPGALFVLGVPSRPALYRISTVTLKKL